MTRLADLLIASLAGLEGCQFEQPPRGMTVVEAKRRLIRVASAAKRADIDGALREERMLYLHALRAIAAGAPDWQRIAKVAACAADIKYDREPGGG